MKGRATAGSATIALVFASMGPGCASGQQAVTSPALVFDEVTIVDVEQGTLQPDQRVVIVGNRIQSVGVGKAIAIPKGARVVDARGEYLIPGLWDMHVHPGHLTDLFYPLFLANGVTGIRDAGSDVPLDTLTLWRREILAGARIGPPRQILSGGVINAPQQGECIPGGQRGSLGGQCIADSAGARQIVDALKAAGADMLKTYDIMRADLYYAVAAEARKAGIPFGGHIEWETEVTASEASDSGASIIDHVSSSGGLDSLCWGVEGRGEQPASIELCRPVAERLRHNNTWHVADLVRETVNRGGADESVAIVTHLDDYSQKFWSGSPPSGTWLHGAANVGRLQPPADSAELMHIVERAGLPIVAGTDIGVSCINDFVAGRDHRLILPGFALHAELAIYAAGGMTSLHALQTATVNPAKLLRATDSMGTVARGKLADLVLLDADPLVDITNTTAIRAVVANGRYFDRAALDQMLAEVQAKIQTIKRKP